MRRALLLVSLGLVTACATAPRPGPTPVAPPPTPSLTPTPTPTATPRAAAAFAEVPPPRLDVGVATDRPSFLLPAGDWLLRIENRVERHAGPIVFSSRPSGGTPLFVVQAGSFGTREAAEARGASLGGQLGVASAVAENAGRFAVRLGAGAERKTAETLLSRVRREAVPDAFLVGAAPAAEVGASVVLEENGDRRDAASPVEIAPLDVATLLRVGETPYRGHLLVRASGRGSVHVVDRVRLEDYLKGVVPSEMGPKVFDELEALKAQAVAARTYAVRHLGDFAAEGYDLCAGPRCQVYGGVPAEQPLTNRAVDDTAGELLLYLGRPADSLFTSTCGGRTESAPNVFPSYTAADFPYLTSVACFGEAEMAIAGAAHALSKPTTLLGFRGRALLHALGRKGDKLADLAEVRRAVRDRLGLPATDGPKSLSPAAVYADLARSGGFGDPHVLVEDVERAHAPRDWPEDARMAWAILERFQLGSGAALPSDRTLGGDEAAGLWVSLLARLGGVEEIDGRAVKLADGLTIKDARGRTAYGVASPLLFRGGADVYTPASNLVLMPGDHVKALVRDGAILALAARDLGAAGTYERDSAWIHWTRRFTSGELAGKLVERDASRRVTRVDGIEVLARGESGRATRVRVATDQGAVVLTGLEIRFALSLPETLFNVTTGRENGGRVFTFYGRGWGHGVGLCQNGAFGMALAAHDYREILARYYPGTEVGRTADTR